MPGRLGIRVAEVALHFLPYGLGIPLKFGRFESRECVTARVRMRVRGDDGSWIDGWGECPMGADWAWPSVLSCPARTGAMQDFCVRLARAWTGFGQPGHALELGWLFLRDILPDRLEAFNDERQSSGAEPLTCLAALVCASAFDLALHDAYGRLMGLPSLRTLEPEHLGRDLAWFYGEGPASAFAGRYPGEYLRARPHAALDVWHLVGGLDTLEDEPGSDKSGDPHESQCQAALPRNLRAWIRQDGIRRLKLKLSGTAEDRGRLLTVGRIADEEGVGMLGIDFNGTLSDIVQVTELLDWLRDEHPRIARLLSYIEQPLGPRDISTPVHQVAARIPLLLDEGAPDWTVLDQAARLGWNGVALKTCKTLTGSILMLCRARAAGMHVMVQDLTNPMLALYPHLLLAAHVDTLGGVEANATQFCPETSGPEARLHPGLFTRKNGRLDLSAIIDAPGLGYAGAESARSLPPPVWQGSAA